MGQSGYSAFKYLNNKINIIVWDDSYSIRKNLRKNFSNIRIKNLKYINWKNIDFVLVSPGINFNHFLLDKPKKLKIPLFRDLEIFSQNVDKEKVIVKWLIERIN